MKMMREEKSRSEPGEGREAGENVQMCLLMLTNELISFIRRMLIKQKSDPERRYHTLLLQVFAYSEKNWSENVN